MHSISTVESKSRPVFPKLLRCGTVLATGLLKKRSSFPLPMYIFRSNAYVNTLLIITLFGVSDQCEQENVNIITILNDILRLRLFYCRFMSKSVKCNSHGN